VRNRQIRGACLKMAPLLEIELADAQTVAAEAHRRGVGALVIGGDHPGLAIARSLGSLGIPVYIMEDQHSIASYSRFVKRVIRSGDIRDQEKTVAAALEAAYRFDLKGWVLFPTRDETVAAFSRYRDLLSRVFRVTTPSWDTVQWAWNKNNTYALARELDIPCPGTWNVSDADELSRFDSLLPLALKPAVKENFFYATGAKAWRANTPLQLRKVFAEALRQIPAKEVMIQEIIPGSGEQQFSFCAFFKEGRAHNILMARRLRQYPREFGRAASYVETADIPALQELSERFLRAINFYGLVEIEFKQDPRDGLYKLLDVNARAWGFHRLGQAVGLNFPLLLVADQLGMTLECHKAQSGLGWMRALTDIPVATADMVRGTLRPSAYLRSIRCSKVESVFCSRDPLPFIAEALLWPFLVMKKHSKRQRMTTATLRLEPEER
jgi:D-aspartate ligase